MKSAYKKLVTDIVSLYEGARKALIKAYWEIGKCIVEVEQKGAIRAAYGDNIIPKVSEDLSKRLGRDLSESHLRRMRQFYLNNPKCAPAHELTWAHHIELLPVRNKKQRLAIEQKAVEEGLKRDEVRELVRHELVREEVEENLKEREEDGGGRVTTNGLHHPSSDIRSAELLVPPKDLRLHTYKKGEIASGTGTMIDCGFYVYREVTKARYESVTVTDKPAYAYEAIVERVIDGDTIWAVIDAGFDTRVREKLRLRGLDCPELGSPEGEAAKRFVAKLLPVGTKILLKTTPSGDKYGRYVADVFIGDQYLNNELLQAGLAVIVKY
ncbi:MAG TPA: DUF1016 N-terminal domain-containing protein [Candidatus Omnitrophota bacterium]|nr:DUF1016 N-terminal domain-containing protein [Candidatus Omnitrophota bacterium]